MHFVGIAETFWQDRGVPVCPTERLQVDEADDLSDGLPWEFAYGRGEMNGCKIWLLASFVSRVQTRDPGSDLAVYLCRTITTEIGHTGGLDDDFAKPGVMDPASAWSVGTPWACRAWAGSARRAFSSAARRASRIMRREQRSASRRGVVRSHLR